MIIQVLNTPQRGPIKWIYIACRSICATYSFILAERKDCSWFILIVLEWTKEPIKSIEFWLCLCLRKPLTQPLSSFRLQAKLLSWADPPYLAVAWARQGKIVKKKDLEVWVCPNFKRVVSWFLSATALANWTVTELSREKGYAVWFHFEIGSKLPVQIAIPNLDKKCLLVHDFQLITKSVSGVS